MPSSRPMTFVSHLRCVPSFRTPFCTTTTASTSTKRPCKQPPSTRAPRATLVRDEPQPGKFNGVVDPSLQASIDDAISAVYEDAASVDVSSKPTDVPLTNDGGPPTRYDRVKLKKYWDARSFELNQRYLAFARRAAPFAASVLRHLATGTLREDEVIGALASQAREGMEALGPTYVKMGQMFSLRPDFLPRAAMDELQKLQANVAPFDDVLARQVIEEELGKPIDEVFSEFSEKPIAAASLAQVYRARLRKEGVEVAVKVQRPDALTLCSKDMYVLQRAVSVYQRFMRSWTAQRVDYDALLESFAGGFYEELDFINEARNQMHARKAVLVNSGGRIYVPLVFNEYTTRRLLVSEFVYGRKLTECEPPELRRLTAIAQECFLRMMLDPGQRLHCDAHGGNQLAWDAKATFEAQGVDFNPNAPAPKSLARGDDGTLLELGLRPELVLLDWGLMMGIPEEDKPKIVLAIVHLVNKDWDAVTEDMISLGFLPDDIERGSVTPLLSRILKPYIIDGGGASAYMKDGAFSPSFRNLMRDMSAAQRELPYSIPNYYPVLGRGIAILEGIALQGDPTYKIVMSAYPFVARRLLEERGDVDGVDDASFRTALNAILYPVNEDGTKQARPSARRMLALINNALGRAAKAEGDIMFDLDALPEETASLAEILGFLGSEQAGAIRRVLIDELTIGSDLVLRSVARRLATSVQNFTSIRLPAPTLPFLAPPRLPVLNPFALVPATIRTAAVDRVAPPLAPEEEIYVSNILELVQEVSGVDLQAVLSGAVGPQDVVRNFTRALTLARGSQDNSGRVAREVLELLIPPQLGNEDEVKKKARESLRSIAQEVFERLGVENSERLGLR